MNRRRQPPPRSTGPSGPVVAGIAIAIVALLGVSLWIATSGSPKPEPTPSQAAKTIATTPQPTRQTPRPTRSAPPPETATPTPTPTPSPTQRLKDPKADKPSFIVGDFEWVTVRSVTDGDTLKLSDGRKVRLLGINTPERGRKLYKEAGDVLRELAGPGSHIIVEFESGARKGQFGRLLGYLHTADGTFINGEILKRGMAYAFIYPNTKIRRAALLAAAAEARGKNLGVWAIEDPKPGSTFIGNRRAPYFHHPGCKRIRRLRGRNKVTFDSRDAALKVGMHPCRDCRS